MFDYSEYRRNLPHYQNAGKIYLVTFVTLKRWILPERARDIVLTETARIHKQHAFVHAGVVTPDHVHLVLQPLWDERGFTYALPTVLGLLKGRSSREINKTLARSGTVWFDESHDHQIRSDESVVEKIDYVLQNPVRAGLVAEADDYPWLFRWWNQDGLKPVPTFVQEPTFRR